MWAALKLVGSVIANCIMQLFHDEHEQELGAARANNAEQAKVLKDVEKANAISNRVDSMSDAKRKQLSADLDRVDL